MRTQKPPKTKKRVSTEKPDTELQAFDHYWCSVVNESDRDAIFRSYGWQQNVDFFRDPLNVPLSLGKDLDGYENDFHGFLHDLWDDAETFLLNNPIEDKPRIEQVDLVKKSRLWETCATTSQKNALEVFHSIRSIQQLLLRKKPMYHSGPVQYEPINRRGNREEWYDLSRLADYERFYCFIADFTVLIHAARNLNFFRYYWSHTKHGAKMSQGPKHRRGAHSEDPLTKEMRRIHILKKGISSPGLTYVKSVWEALEVGRGGIVSIDKQGNWQHRKLIRTKRSGDTAMTFPEFRRKLSDLKR
jgi:hypothetical protein